MATEAYAKINMMRVSFQEGRVYVRVAIFANVAARQANKAILADRAYEYDIPGTFPANPQAAFYTRLKEHADFDKAVDV